MKHSRRILSGVVVLIGGILGCAPKIPVTNPPSNPEISQKIPNELKKQHSSEVTLKTSDGWSIVGQLYPPVGQSKGGVVLLHQRGGSSADWNPLCTSLQEAGYAALAIDQRGAGKSTGPGSSGESAPWDTSGDIAAAAALMKQYGHVTLIGASYGANNALIYAAAHSEEIHSVVLLSPGENYHGLEALPAAQKYPGHVLILHDRGDTVAGDGPSKINSASTLSQHNLIEYDGDGHGTELLRSQSINDIIEFLKKSQ